MKINIQIAIVRQFGIIALVTTLISSTILCAPQPSHHHHQLQSQQQQQQQQQQSPGASTTATTTSSNAAAKSALSSFLSRQTSSSSMSPPSSAAAAASTATTSATSASTVPAATSPPVGSGSSSTGSSQQSSSLSSVASELNGSPLFVNMQDGATVDDNNERHSAALNTFDGKNPFADESLWQIPIHLVRDSSASDDAPPGRLSHGDKMAKSASEMSPADEHDDAMSAAAAANDNDNDYDENSRASSLGLSQQHPKGSHSASSLLSSLASSAPTVILASTDLKTAAGYHHATPHHGYEGGAGAHYGHDASHQHHDKHDHYGKYFQYANVPYPYAWDFGYRRGNPYHTIERYEHGKGPHFQTKVKWSDKHGGYGVHVWDYNHDDHHSQHYGSGDHGHHGYDSHGPAHYGAGAHHHHASSGHYGEHH